ncbi:MAG TPA: hypothetical protein VGM29_00525, partial [Polyangiaceae bacterium]
LWFRRARAPLIVAGILLHMGMFVTLEVGSFGPACWLLYLCFLDPKRVHAFVDDVVAGSKVD